MKAIVLEQYGGPEALKYAEVSKPVPGPGEVLVRVHASTINRSTLKRAAGLLRGIVPELEFPWIPGADFSGVVTEVGVNVLDFRPGDEVFSYGGPGGAFAEYIALDAALVASKPSALTHEQAASLALVGQTALQILEESALKAGQSLLILGAGGSVGNITTQLAKALHARVLVLCRTRSIGRLRSLGADEVVDDNTTRFETIVKDVDVVVDCLGGEFEKRGFAVLKNGGVFISLMHPPSQEEARVHNARAILMRTRNNPRTLEALGQTMAEGQLKSFIGRTYPLKDAIQAWKDYEAGSVEGKLVVTNAWHAGDGLAGSNA